MGVFDNFPYTNIHDLNTDWLVKTVKQVKDKTDEIDQSVLDAKNYADNAKTSEDNAKISEDNAKSSEDGASLIFSNIQSYTENLSDRINENSEDIAIQTARIDSIISGTTPDANAELIDIRIGADGTTYPTAGDAVRDQITVLDDTISTLVPLHYKTKHVYQSSGTASDYTSGLAVGTLALLWKNETWYNHKMPYFIPKNTVISHAKLYKRTTQTANIVLLKRNSAAWSFSIIDKIQITTGDNTLNYTTSDDYFIGVESVTANAIAIGNVLTGDNGYYINATSGNIGDTVSFTNQGVVRGVNIDIDITMPLENGVCHNVIPVGTGKIFTNPVFAVEGVNALNDSNKNNVYDLIIDSGTYDVITLLGGTPWLQSLTAADYMAGVLPNDYVNLYGIGDCTLSAQIADAVVTPLMSELVSTINLKYNNIIDNIKFIARNVRYACHDETGSTNDSKLHNRVRTVTNCLFNHLGNLSGLWSSTLGYGAGFQYGDKFTYKNCIFSSASWHDNITAPEPSYFDIDNCVIRQTIKFGSVVAGNKHIVNIDNCSIGYSIQNIEEVPNSGVGNNFTITGGGNSVVSQKYDNVPIMLSDECYYKQSGSGQLIPAGTAVKHQYGAVVPMSDNDDLSLFAGIALEDIPTSGYGLVQYRGYIMLSQFGITRSMFDKLSIVNDQLTVSNVKPVLIVNGITNDFAKIIV